MIISVINVITICDHLYEYYDDDDNDQKYMICYSSDIKSVTNNISYVHVIYM